SGAIDEMAPVDCTRKHNCEFVGVYPAPASAAYPKTSAAWQRIHVGCRKVVAAYAKLPDDKELEFRTGTVVVPNLQDDWSAGNHGVRCYLYLKNGAFSKSLKGAGPKALPPQ
ncbi:MAG TPA: septum formation family protein, partial [Micromonosporaceae bacterium]|nr:septum formation family protein [Micromonosporaceae bacterium]